MSDLRKEFEALPEIADSLSEHIWFGDDNKYHTAIIGFEKLVSWLNGAWFAFQEQQKKIDAALGFTNDVHSENWQEAIHCIKELLK